MRVLYVQYTNPGAYPPLVRGAQLLAEAGADVTMLGTAVTGLDALGAASTGRVNVQLLPAAESGWRLKAHYARYAAWVAREASSIRPDWIYASDLFSAPVALAAAAVSRAGIVYHEHDAPSTSHQSWVVRQCMIARERLVREAAIVVAPNAERAARLSQLGGGRAIHTVWNCPRRPNGLAPAERSHDGVRVIFRGSINSERLPLTVVEALAKVDGATLDVAGYETAGSRGYSATLGDHAKSLGIGDRVALLGAVPERELSAICRQRDVGLALMPVDSLDENMRHMTGASNKVFEYLEHGVTPLVSDLPDWRATFVDPGYALACDPRDADSIARAFIFARDARSEAREMAERGRLRLQRDWNYETQFAPIADAMSGVATSGSLESSAHASVEAEAQCAS